MADAFMAQVEKWGGPILSLIDKMKQLATQAGSSIAAVLTDIVTDPIGIMTKVFDSLKTGFTNFLNNIVETGKNAFLQWLFGPIDTLVQSIKTPP